jgi:hypothetical protein
MRAQVLERRRDLDERLAHIDEAMVYCGWPFERGVAEFLEMDSIMLHNTISEQQYYDELDDARDAEIIAFCREEAWCDDGFHAYSEDVVDFGWDDVYDVDGFHAYPDDV